MANKIASYLPSSSFLSRVSTLPLRAPILKSLRYFNSCEERLKLLVPINDPIGRSANFSPFLEIKASKGFSRLVITEICNYSGSIIGTSFILWTAISTSLDNNASSISLTNKPLPPIFARGTS